MQPPEILEVRDLVKDYPKVRAVDGVSFGIREGICFGLLGPNGAGKTTTIEMIEGILPQTSGQILFRGEPAGARFRESAGIQFQETAIQDYLTVREVLKMFSSFYPRTASVEELIKLCALEEFLDRDSHELSGGQRQRMLLAVGLVNDPDIVFLDEPTTGLDPQARRGFWDLVRELKRRGKTVVLTTHYMEEAYALCDEIAIMDHGKIIARGSPDSLLKKYFDTVKIELPREAMPFEPSSLTWPTRELEGKVEIRTPDVNATLAHLMKAGAKLTHLKLDAPTLDDLFLHLTGKELRE